MNEQKQNSVNTNAQYYGKKKFVVVTEQYRIYLYATKVDVVEGKLCFNLNDLGETVFNEWFFYSEIQDEFDDTDIILPIIFYSIEER